MASPLPDKKAAPTPKPKKGSVSASPKAELSAQGARNIAMILTHPHISEKSFSEADRGHYTFIVDRRSNKHQIAAAVSSFYNVAVTKVRIISQPAKPRRYRFGRKILKAGFKKAVVYLADGHTIDTFSKT